MCWTQSQTPQIVDPRSPREASDLFTNSLNLVDSWRYINPKGREFTYFSPLHQKYSHIDFLFMSPNFDNQIQHRVHGYFWSSPSSTLSEITHPRNKANPRNNSWRLNPFLLKQKEDVSLLIKELTQYFELNDTQEVTTLEAHKCTMRGSLIKMGVFRKGKRKEKPYKIVSLNWNRHIN